jgi:hypothetical protein
MENKVKEGQIWSYKTRRSEEGSRLMIIKVDEADLIVNIKIDGLKLTEKDSGDAMATSIEHLPISFEMFKKSAHKIESVVEPVVSEGYLYWKKLFDEGKAGVWSVEISNAIGITEETYNS